MYTLEEDDIREARYLVETEVNITREAAKPIASLRHNNRHPSFC